MITYQQEPDLSVAEFRQVLINSTLAERRPVDEPQRLEGMLKHGNLIITARDGDLLVGVARSLTDFSFCTYMSDLAVHQDYQKHGIGKELIRRTKELSPKAKLILLAAPKAQSYYPHIGMKQWEHCYFLDDPNELR